MLPAPDWTAMDSFAFDRQTARIVDQDGHMRIRGSILTRAAVNGYKATEIPGWEELNLDRNRIYKLYRDPEALKVGVDTLDGKPLLLRHQPISADDHPKDIVVGSVSNPEFRNGDIIGDLIVWDKDGIEVIEDGSQKDLSCGYRYVPIIKAGTTPDGQKFDGMMTKIQFNHCALVHTGRVNGAVVADSADELLWARLEQALNTILRI
jgi:uncharacterized protein